MALFPCQVSDLRNQIYPEDGLGQFPGEGRVVGRQKMRKVTDRVEETSGKRDPKVGWGAVQSKLQVASPSTYSSSWAKAPNALPAGSRMTAEQFLNRLPKCIIRQGEVIDIRGPIRDTLQVRPALITQQPSAGDFYHQPWLSLQSLARGKETLRTKSCLCGAGEDSVPRHPQDNLVGGYN